MILYAIKNKKNKKLILRDKKIEANWTQKQTYSNIQVEPSIFLKISLATTCSPVKQKSKVNSDITHDSITTLRSNCLTPARCITKPGPQFWELNHGFTQKQESLSPENSRN